MDNTSEDPTEEPTEEPSRDLTTFGSHAKQTMTDGTVIVGYIPEIVTPRTAAPGSSQRVLEFTPVVLPEETLKELLDEQRKTNRPLILLGQVIIIPEVKTGG